MSERKWGETYRDDNGKLTKWFPVHEGQAAILEAKTRFIVALAGSGGGKTAVIPLWLMQQIEKHPQGRFVVVSPNYKMMRGSVIYELTNAFADCVPGEMKIEDACYQCKSGAAVYFFSADNPQSIQGIHADGLVLDEAGLMAGQIWEIARQRTNFKKAPILITSTPYGFNWLFHQVYKPWKEGDDRFTVVNFSSLSNPQYNREEYEYERKTLPEWRFKMKYEGRFTKPVGVVFPDIDSCLIDPDDMPDPEDCQYIGGLDFGFNDPCAAIAGFVRDNCLYLGYEKYARNKTVKEFATDLPKQVYWFADSSRPDSIKELKRDGFRIRPCKKYAGSVSDNIDIVNGLIRSNRLKIAKGFVNALIEEAEVYSYQGDDNGGFSDKPIDSNNHAIDATCYLSQGAKRIGLLRDKG